jgi:type VI secretion system secreted protein VgrG
VSLRAQRSTGFPPGSVTGSINIANGFAGAAQNELTTAYNTAANLPSNGANPPDLGGTTVFPGVYTSISSLQLTGTVTLNGLGNANSVFVFQIGSTLTTASNSAVVLINGASAANVYWQVGSSATLGTGTSFAGNILAQASISFGTGATLLGRALARTGAVTLLGNAITVPSPVVVVPTPTPTTYADPNSHADANANSHTDAYADTDPYTVANAFPDPSPFLPRAGVDCHVFRPLVSGPKAL